VSLSLSPQLRMIVIFGAAAVVLAMGGMLFVMRGAIMSSEVEQVPVVVHHPKPAAKPDAKPAHAAPKPHAATKANNAATKPAHKAEATPAVPAPKEAAAPKTTTPEPTAPEVAVPKPHAAPTIETPGVAENGLPIVIAQALKKHPVVVVALVVPGGEVDELTEAEGKAGAKAAGTGFLTINILKNSIGRPLAQKLGVIQTPSLVVFQRPAKVFVRFAGFVDRDTVEQAATSARATR
jgi:hypothetical protein